MDPEHYVAYHSATLMGETYSGGSELSFFSRKRESQLRKVIGQTLWVIANDGERPARYYLAGAYTPSTIEPEGDGWQILGNGIAFKPRMELTRLPWFNTLFNEQNNFSYGLNRIKSAEVIQALRAIQDTKRDAAVLPGELIDGLYSEGVAISVMVNKYERDRAARAACLGKFGATCQVCGVNLEQVYGKVAAGLIHVHHLTPISAIGREYKLDPLHDLIPICPNCHAVAHTQNPPLSPGEIRSTMSRPEEAKKQPH